MFKFKVLAKDKKSKARVGQFETPHGKLLTPELAFVATEGEIKSIPKKVLPTLPVKLIIVNTFHLWTKAILPDRGGREKSVATIHDYANFKNPIMSDSGGFQVFSLGFGQTHKVGKIAPIFPDESKERFPLIDSGLSQMSKYQRKSASNQRESKRYDSGNPLKITDQGVEFIYNGKKILLTPEKSIQLQKQIGADIIFAFDECTSPLNSYAYTKEAMERTHQWLTRCIKVWNKKRVSRNGRPNESSDYILQSKMRGSERVWAVSRQDPLFFQTLFGIVQGGYFEDLRKKSAKFVGKQDVAGFGIGGSLGRSKEDVWQVLEWTTRLLPEEKPRHLLGIGQVRDIFESVERGVDLFDCVIPTREARHRILYTNRGRLNLKKFRHVDEPIDKNCKCQTCYDKVTMKQLNNLFLLKDPRAFLFSTLHNIQFYVDLMKNIREAISLNEFKALKQRYLNFY